MDIELRLRETLVLHDPGAPFTDTVMARVASAPVVPPRNGVRLLSEARARKRARRILFSSLVVLAAAASMLFLFQDHEGEPAALQAIALQSGDSVPAGSSIGFQVVAPADLPATDQQSTPGSFTVRVPPLIDGNDKTGATFAQNFRDAVVAKLLRDVPGLALVDPGVLATDYDIRIRIGDLLGNTTQIEVDAGIPASLDAMAKLVSGDVLQQVEAAKKRGPAVPPLGGPPPPPDVGLHKVIPKGDPDVLAARLVQDLRVQVFPVLPSLQRELFATMNDARRESSQRLYALGDLLTLAIRRGGTPQAIDAETVRAGAGLALSAADSSTREQAWEVLRTTRHTALVPELARGLEMEPEEKIRVQLVSILGGEFKSDARAQAALQAAAQNNPLQNVRLAAQRELYGDSGWAAQLGAALNDVTQPLKQRLQTVANVVASEAAPADAATAGSQATQLKRELSDQAIRDLGNLLIEGARDPDAGAMARDALNTLGTVGGPVVRDVVIQILRSPYGGPQDGSSVSVKGLRSAALTLSHKRYWKDAELRAVVAELAPTDPEARQVLSLMDMKSRMD